MDTMYPAKINSPATTLSSGINDIVTTIPLTDASVVPAAPNLAVIGIGEDAETVLYTGKSGNDLTGCTRGFQGTAKAWDSGTSVARFFTAYDCDTLRTNLSTHDGEETAGVHGSTTAADANKLVHRDANGRSAIAAPISSGQIDNKAARDGAISTHNAGVLSHLVHDNDNFFIGYGNEVVEGLPTSSDIGAKPSATKAPALVAIQDPLSKLDISDWYGASGAYKQADADSDATHIEDDSETFPSSLRNTVVKWASNSAGTSDTGYGIIKAVDSDTLTIIKCSGADFAASYYYWIKHSEWVVPVTGIYVVEFAVLALPAEVDKSIQAYLCYHQGTSQSVLNAQFALHSPVDAYCMPAGATITDFTADDHVWVGLSHSGTSGTPALYTTDPSHIRLRMFLLKQTA